MKKFFVLFVLSLFAIAVFAKESVKVKHSQQNETFSWQPVENAGKYQITIEKLKSDGTWEKVISHKTPSTSYRASLAPGHYRMAVSTFNILGKKGATSEWTEFKVLDVSIPYLFDNYFEKSKEWKSPVLYINLKNEDLSQNPDSKKYIPAVEKFGENTFFVKGKNIFTTDTQFYLIPEPDTSKNAASFIPFYDNRESVSLSVVERNEKKSGVYLSYNPEQLSSGYYLLQAKKNGNCSDSIEILVLAERPLELRPSDFKVDTRYKVNALEIDGSSQVSFYAEGRGFSQLTEFTMQPADGAIRYAYASEQERQIVPLTIASKQNSASNGMLKLSFECDGSLLKSGYYNVVARNSETDSSRFLILVKQQIPKSAEERIQKVSSKYNKRTKNVDFTLAADDITSDMKFTLISAYPEQGGEQRRIPLYFTKVPAKKKYTVSVPSEDLLFDDYMLLVETSDSSFSKYFSLDNHYSIHPKNYSESEVAKLFLPHENEEDSFEVTLDTDETGIVTYNSSKVEVISLFPKIMPFLRPTAGVNDNFFGDVDKAKEAAQSATTQTSYVQNNDSHIHSDLRFQFDVMNLYWFALGANLKFNPNVINNVTHLDFAPEITAKFLVDERISPGWELFTPYIGAGLGYNIVDRNYDSPFYNFDHDLYAFAFAGCTLLKLYELSYQIEYHNLQNPSLAYLNMLEFNFGIRLPIRRTYYSQKVLARSAEIAKNGTVMVNEYEELNARDINTIIITDGAKSVGGMESYKYVENVQIGKSVEEIKKDAFSNCSNLKEVRFLSNNNLKTIRNGAFENDTRILKIIIPNSVQTIEKDAFKGWTYGQQIIFTGVSKFQAEERDFEGLKNIDAMVVFGNYTEFKSKTPFEDCRNYMNTKEKLFTSESFYDADSDSYTLALKMEGYGTSIESMLNHDYFSGNSCRSSPELLEYFKSGKELSFKVYGDGRAYVLYVRTQGDGVFSTRFTTKKNKVSQLSFEYSDLTKARCSKVRKFKKDEVVCVTLVPIYDGKRSNSYFYDFKVE
ncbi:MAG: leucine-rich repeat protein [Treponema sp.]|nr:leucine-rich repeat protein [Treponema sp.]